MDSIEDFDIPGYKYATILDKDRVEPMIFQAIYHGTSELQPEKIKLFGGLPAKGMDIDLVRHVEPLPGAAENSAFRGTVQFPLSPGFDSGAALWAGEGGWVYKISDYPGYDICRLLEGKIPDGNGGFRGPLMSGEQEVAIPARVSSSKIRAVGDVVLRRGRYRVVWRHQ
jgi:hypothetical protein